MTLGAGLGGAEAEQAAAGAHGLHLRSARDLRQEGVERVTSCDLQPFFEEEVEPLPVVDGDAGAFLLAEKVDRDLLQLLAAKLTMRLKRELRGDAEHLVHSAKQTHRLLNLP